MVKNIIIIGIGYAGCKIVSELNVKYKKLFIDTDKDVIEKYNGLRIGEKICGEFSASGNINLAELSVRESKDNLLSAIENYNEIILIAPLGGGTSCGVTKKITELILDNNKSVKVFTSMPYDFEGKSIFQPQSKSNVIMFVTKRLSSLPYLPREKNGKWGIVPFLAEENKTVIPFEYDYCDNFYEYELAKVKKNRKYGFINPKNEIVIPIEYDRVGVFGFKYGVCLVEKDGCCGFIDKDNNFVIPLMYGTSSNEFIEGIACVEVNREAETYYKYISTNGDNAF